MRGLYIPGTLTCNDLPYAMLSQQGKRTPHNQVIAVERHGIKDDATWFRIFATQSPIAASSLGLKTESGVR
jgi:hypothetical protein